MVESNDLKTVADYNRQRQLEIFKGQCFNNASAILSNMVWSETIPQDVFDLAQELYDEGLKRGWLEIKEKEHGIL